MQLVKSPPQYRRILKISQIVIAIIILNPPPPCRVFDKYTNTPLPFNSAGSYGRRERLRLEKYSVLCGECHQVRQRQTRGDQ
jgi:hypothetical protein